MTDEKQQSTDIAARIEETKAQLHEVETALAALPEERDQILGMEQIDDEALDAIDARGAQLARQRDHLQKRIPLLEQQREAAARDEAQARLDALPAAAEALREEAQVLYLELIGFEGKFVDKFRELEGLYAKERLLRSEERFLAVRYRLPRMRAQMPPLDDPKGQFAELREIIMYGLGRAAAGDGSLTVFDQQLKAWEDAGRPTTLPRPRPVPPARPAPETFTVTLPDQQGGTGTVTLNADGHARAFLLTPARGYPQNWTFSDVRAGTIRGDLPAWVEQVPALKELVDKVRAEKGKAA